MGQESCLRTEGDVCSTSLGAAMLQFEFTASGSRRGSKENVASSTNSVFLTLSLYHHTWSS